MPERSPLSRGGGAISGAGGGVLSTRATERPLTPGYGALTACSRDGGALTAAAPVTVARPGPGGGPVVAGLAARRSRRGRGNGRLGAPPVGAWRSMGPALAYQT